MSASQKHKTTTPSSSGQACPACARHRLREMGIRVSRKRSPEPAWAARTGTATRVRLRSKLPYSYSFSELLESSTGREGTNTTTSRWPYQLSRRRQVRPSDRRWKTANACGWPDVRDGNRHHRFRNQSCPGPTRSECQIRKRSAFERAANPWGIPQSGCREPDTGEVRPGETRPALILLGATPPARERNASAPSRSEGRCRLCKAKFFVASTWSLHGQGHHLLDIPQNRAVAWHWCAGPSATIRGKD
jgi:hypothetical protein